MWLAKTASWRDFTVSFYCWWKKYAEVCRTRIRVLYHLCVPLTDHVKIPSLPPERVLSVTTEASEVSEVGILQQIG